MPQKRYKFKVRGALALVLYVSRALCVAPVVFETRGVRVSRLLSLFGRVIVTLMGIHYIVDIYLEGIYFKSKNSVASFFIWAFSTAAILTMDIMGVWTAATRMQLHLESFQDLHLINEDKPDGNLKTAEKKIDLIIGGWVVIYTIQDAAMYIYSGIMILDNYDGIMRIQLVSQLIVNCYESLLFNLLITQFALVTLRVWLTLNNVNIHFNRLIENHGSHKIVLQASSIQQFAVQYISICDIVSQTVENAEKNLIVLLSTFFLYLGFFIQTIVADMYKYHMHELVSVLSRIILTGGTYLIYLLLLIEPSHRVQEQMEVTRALVCKLMQGPNLSVQVTNELEAFNLLLKLNKPTYSPLRVCVLARPLLLKILGAFASNGALVAQFGEDF